MSSARTTYDPLDVPKPVAPNVWIVDSGPMNAMGIPLPVRMTVLRLSDGGLLLHSPTRFDAKLRDALRELGPIRHLVAPNIAHWTFLARWQAHEPEARLWVAPGLADRAQVRRSSLRIDAELDPLGTPAFGDEIEMIAVEGAGGFCEIAFFHKPSSTLILTDLVQNLEPRKLPLWFRPLARAAGITSPDGRAPIYLRAIVKAKGGASRAAADRLVALEPERVIFAHGLWFRTEGAQRLATSLRWLTSRSA